MRWLALSTILLLLLSQNAQAFLEDKEARKKITENQTLNQSAINALKSSQQALEERVASMEAVLKGQGLLDLLSQVERLKQELSQVKGDLEIATHNISNGQQRQQELYADTDARLRQLESAAAQTVDAEHAQAAGADPEAGEAVTETEAGNEDIAVSSEIPASPSEAGDFAAAQSLAAASRHREAFDAFNNYLRDYPTSSRVPDAMYALGYSQFSLKNYKAAIATQQKLIQQFPKHAKAAEAMFNVANAQIQLSEIENAKKTLRTLLSQYPQSEVAPSAEKRLSVLESIKVR